VSKHNGGQVVSKRPKRRNEETQRRETNEFSEIAAIVRGCNVGKPRVNLSFGAPHKNGDLGDVVGFLTLLGL